MFYSESFRFETGALALLFVPSDASLITRLNRKKAGEAYPFVLIIEFSPIQYTKGISTLFSITCLTWFKNPLLKSDFIIFFLWLLLSATFGDESEQNFWSMWISPVLYTFLNFLTYRIVKILYPFRVFSFNYYKKQQAFFHSFSLNSPHLKYYSLFSVYKIEDKSI